MSYLAASPHFGYAAPQYSVTGPDPQESQNAAEPPTAEVHRLGATPQNTSSSSSPAAPSPPGSFISSRSALGVSHDPVASLGSLGGHHDARTEDPSNPYDGFHSTSLYHPARLPSGATSLTVNGLYQSSTESAPGGYVPSAPFYPATGNWGVPPAGSYPYDPAGLAYTPYGDRYSSTMDSVARRKNATRETTNTLKAWLYEHRKNPYPTKGEKIMLAIITKMTLTQVSTWFANARRRLKKENKMTWEPRNRPAEEEDKTRTNDDEDDDDDDDVVPPSDDRERASNQITNNKSTGTRPAYPTSASSRYESSNSDLSREPADAHALSKYAEKYHNNSPDVTHQKYHTPEKYHCVPPHPDASRSPFHTGHMFSSSTSPKPKIWSLAQTAAQSELLEASRYYGSDGSYFGAAESFMPQSKYHAGGGNEVAHKYHSPSQQQWSPAGQALNLAAPDERKSPYETEYRAQAM